MLIRCENGRVLVCDNCVFRISHLSVKGQDKYSIDTKIWNGEKFHVATFDSYEDAIKCLDSIQSYFGDTSKVVVVDFRSLK